MVWVWLGIALLFIIIEILPGPFGFTLVSVSALIAAALDAVGQPVWAQTVVFGASSLILLTFLRSRIVHKIAAAPGVPSRTEKLVGRRGRVVEALDAAGGHGRVLVEGTDWAADSADKRPISAGAEVEIVGSRGIRLIVRPVGG